MERRPPWLVKRLPRRSPAPVENLLGELSLNTVCRSARCPNRLECFAAGTATFLILGDRCTRDCRFCAVPSGRPRAPDPDEPRRVAEAARRLRLRYVVVTSVTRDDLPDGGAGHFAAVVRRVREATGAEVEVLVPDFRGEPAAVETVLAAGPAVFNHNVETVPRLYGEVRPQADFQRSLAVLRQAAASGIPVKSGFMVGLGESEEEVLALLGELRRCGVAIVTIGQYLRPRGGTLPVKEYVEPGRFDHYRRRALEMGFLAAASGPFVRSSYRAAELARHARAGRMGEGNAGKD